MNLPAVYYLGRENPPHSEIWFCYFLRMVLLYSNKVRELSEESNENELEGSLSYLKKREKELLLFLVEKQRWEFSPIDLSKEFTVTNKTIINRLSILVKNGFVEPNLVNQRIRSYNLTDFTRLHEKEIRKLINNK